MLSDLLRFDLQNLNQLIVDREDEWEIGLVRLEAEEIPPEPNLEGNFHAEKTREMCEESQEEWEEQIFLLGDLY